MDAEMSVPWKAQGPLSHCVADDEGAGVDETCQTAPQLTAPDVTAAGWQPGCDVPTPLEIPLLYGGAEAPRSDLILENAPLDPVEPPHSP